MKKNFWEKLKTGEFAQMVRESSTGQGINNAQEVYNIIKPMTIEEPDIEQMYCLFLNNKNKVIDIEQVFKGTISQCAVYPRELIKKCLQKEATSIILAHNHPSGETEPSTEDFVITKQVNVGARALGITLHDHIIVGNNKFYSFGDSGVLDFIRKGLEDFLYKQEIKI